MASIVLSLLGPVIELGKCIYDPLKRQCGFLLCYKKEVHVLRKEVNSLCTQRDDIERKLEEKRRDRQLPLKKVEERKSNADKLVREVEELETQLKEESTCLNGWCPNLSWRYRLGKSAATKVDEAKELKKKCEGFGDLLTYLPQQPNIEPIRGDPMQKNEVTMTIMEHVMQALRDDNIRSIGIHGMGGIGKTTLVDKINNKLLGTQLFDKVIKVIVSQIVNEKAIQDTMAKRLELNLDRDDTINARANVLVQRLKEHQRVLIILDDVWSQLDIVKIGIPNEDEHKNCKIIVTTRNQYVCREMDLQFEVKPLSDIDSWSLFEQKIGHVVSKNPILLSIAKSIVGECKGTPLAIVTIGSTLRQEENEIMWKDALRRLKSSEPTELEGIMPQVITSIKYSYDYLEDEEMKLCFLLCCLFPEDYNIDLSELRRYILGEGFLKVDGNLLQSQEKLEANIIKLKRCNLLLDGEKEGEVKMHDIVRDTAKWIGWKNGQGFVVKTGLGLTNWPQLKEENNVQRISLMGNDIKRLSQSPKLPQLRTLLFEGSTYNRPLEHIEDNFFEGMKALVNLDLGGTKLSRLPSSISCLTNLRTLVLNNDFEELDVSIIGELKRLEILELNKCNFSIKFVQWTNLRVLHMDIPLSAIPTNVISKLVHLEELHLSLNYGSKKINDESEYCSLVEVTSLECLTSLQVVVDEVQLLSQDVPFHLNQLRAFCIIIQENVEEYDDDYIEYHKYYEYDKVLVFEQISLPVQDWIMNLLKITEYLMLNSCEEEISRLMGSMATLKILGLGHSKSIEHLVNAQGSPLAVDAFGRLEKLALNSLSNLEKICEGPLLYGFGMNLRELYVNGCEKLTTLLPFDVLQAMHSLESLTIKDCESMRHIVSTAEAPSSTLEKILEGLHVLLLVGMPNLIGICNGPIPSRFLRNLKQLNICNCERFKGVFPWGLALETVQTVMRGEVFCDLSTHFIPPNALGTLEELRLSDIKQMKKVFHESCPTHPLDSIDGRVLYNLRFMQLIGLPKLQCLFSFRIALFLPNLSFLRITDCEKLETVIAKENEDEIVLATQNLLPMLEAIELSNLPKLTGLYSGSGVLHLPSLETIEVSKCIKLMQLSLEPDSCPKLRQIKGGKKWFQALEQEMQEEIVRSRFQALFVATSWIDDFENVQENEDQDEGVQVENESYT